MGKTTNNEAGSDDGIKGPLEAPLMAAAEAAWKTHGLPVAGTVMPDWDSYPVERKCDVEAAWEAGFVTALLLQREAMRIAKSQ